MHHRILVKIRADSEDEALKVISILKDKKLLPLFTANPKLQ